MSNNSRLDEIKVLLKEKNFDSAIQSMIEYKSELISSARETVNLKEKRNLIDTVKSVDRLIEKTEIKRRSKQEILIEEEPEANLEPQQESVRSSLTIVDILQPLSQKVKNEFIIPMFYQHPSAKNFQGAFIFGSDIDIIEQIIRRFEDEVDFNNVHYDPKSDSNLENIAKKGLIPFISKDTKRSVVCIKISANDFRKQTVALLLQQAALANFNQSQKVILVLYYDSLEWQEDWGEQLQGLEPIFIDFPTKEQRIVMIYRAFEDGQLDPSMLDVLASKTAHYSYFALAKVLDEISQSSIHESNFNMLSFFDSLREAKASRQEEYKMVYDSIETSHNYYLEEQNSNNQKGLDNAINEETKTETTQFEPVIGSGEENIFTEKLLDEQVYEEQEEYHLESIQRIQSAFDEYAIKHGDITYIEGAVFTRYRIPLARGERINKVTKSLNEIKMRLRSPNVRIIAPIENDDAIGIELPNRIRKSVPFSAINKKQDDLRVPIGLDINNEIVYLDFSKDPHYIIAGSTGSGKSVNLNVIIAYFLVHKSPEEVSILLVDPKQVEFNNLKNLAHMITPRALNEIEEINSGLTELIELMNKRFKMFSDHGYRNIKEYNQANSPIPYIIGIIDEFATISEDEDIMNNIQKLSQLSRAAGIHLILATQRPSTDIVRGTIKNNFTGRIAFRVAAGQDSRTVIFESGAEELIGQGDMLIANSGMPIRRAQGAYISLSELNNYMHSSRLKYQHKNSIQLRKV